MNRSDRTLPFLHEILVSQLKGVDSSITEKLARLNILTVQDLLLHLPIRYQDRTRITAIAQLKANSEAQIEGTITQVEKHKKSLLCSVADSSGYIYIRFFHFGHTKRPSPFKNGQLIRCYGEATWSRSHHMVMEMNHPEFKIFGACTPPSSLETKLSAIYPSTKGLGQHTLRQLYQQALQLIGSNQCQLPECLPKSIIQQYGLPPIANAIAIIHQPTPDKFHNSIEPIDDRCYLRLIFEELLAHHIIFRTLRDTARKQKAIALTETSNLHDKLKRQLTFDLTRAQCRVHREICHDLEKAVPMLRLVQGDVGSGKTVIAALAILQAIGNGCQAALIAPTEILAEQHLINLSRWLTPMKINIGGLTGRTREKEKQQILQALASGQLDLIMGTHALLEDCVIFKNLSLVVIDEQHRFGVRQRMTMQKKGIKDTLPHQLIMTATPIPRTLAMTLYADLDISIIDELPPGRTPIDTRVMDESHRSRLIQRVGHACLSGRQAYWVCTLIEESETLEHQAAETTTEYLKSALPEVNIGLIHGRMKPSEKNNIMSAFKEGSIQLLVATTVIEVGVDVPNASLMIIENAEKLGLSQLHQLRGRVGRGCTDSYCILLYHHPLSAIAQARLSIMRNSSDGFEIAEKDLTLRGPGEVMGQKQAGMIAFRVACLERDAILLDTIKPLAKKLVKEHPQQCKTITNRWFSSRKQFVSA